jgi:hypothetical protein
MPETPKGPKKPAKTTRAAQEAAKAIGKAKVAAKATKASTPAKKTGRPSKYDPEIARVICEQLSEGIPLRQICRNNEGFPAWRTVYDWMGRDEELSASIARARDIGYDAIAEECLQIADTIHLGQRKVYSAGAEEGEDSVTVHEEDMLGHRKLQIETRLKLLAKFHPTKYGDKLGLHGVEGAAPISTEDATASKFLEVIRNMEMTKRVG